MHSYLNLLFFCFFSFLFHFVRVHALYHITNVTSTNNGFKADLYSTDPYSMSPLQIYLNFYQILYNSNPYFFVNLVITDKLDTRYRFPYINNLEFGLYEDFKIDYKLIFGKYVAVYRKTDTEPLVSLKLLNFSNQLIEIETPISSQSYLYGLGERHTNLTLAPRNYTFFNCDEGDPDAKDLPLYGSHPFYLDVRHGLSHGSLMYTSNIMDIELSSDKLKYKILGGMIDYWLFLGENPDITIFQYHALIGKPFLPPLWSLGFHICRYGYENISVVEDVAKNFEKNGLPLDASWIDIDYMDGYRIFTTDPIKFPLSNMSRFVSQSHSAGRHVVLIIDPGVKIDSNYHIYQRGLEQNIFIRDPDGHKPYIGKVWPGLVHFPDWFHPNMSTFWTKEIQTAQNQLPFDGLWTDMNEVANFCNGRCNILYEDPSVSQFSCNCSVQFNSLFYDQPPFIPFDLENPSHYCPVDTTQGLDCGSLSMGSLHYPNLREFDVHNLFGYMMSKQTQISLNKIRNKRSLVLSRSTFIGSGQYTAHWLGDNHSTWEAMRQSIIDIISFNLFGIPLVGADICGFTGDTTPELCRRWMQLGSLYPFSRNHNSIVSHVMQEPYALGEDVLMASQIALLLRYSLIPYYYTLFANANQHGGVIIKGLYYDYPQDKIALTIDQQFLIGSSLLACPVLYPGVDQIQCYFPDATWYDFYNGEKISIGYHDIPVGLYSIPLYIRGGYIVAMQTPQTNTQLQKYSPYSLLIALLSQQGKPYASGKLYLDDGESLNSQSAFYAYEVISNEEYGPYNFIIRGSRIYDNYTQSLSHHLYFNQFEVFGLTFCPKECKSSADFIPSVQNTTISFHYQQNILIFDGFSLPIQDFSLYFFCDCPFSSIWKWIVLGVGLSCSFILITFGLWYIWRRVISKAKLDYGYGYQIFKE